MISFDLKNILKAEIGGNTKDLVTRPTGQTVRERIEHDLEMTPEGSVIGLDFSKVGVVDYSCADEIAAKLVSRLLSGEYGDRYLLFTGLNENQKENIEVALERKGLAAVAEMLGGKRLLLGSLHNYLKDTLEHVAMEGRVTAKDLADAKKLEANTSGTRLLNLAKKRLVKRAEELRQDGKVWVYETL